MEKEGSLSMEIEGTPLSVLTKRPLFTSGQAGTVRVVVGGDYFDIMTSEVDQTKGQGQLFWMSIVQYPLHFPPKNFFWVGSIGVDQDLLLPGQISLWGGIQ